MSGEPCDGRGAPTLTVIGCVQADVLMSPVSGLPPPGGALLTDEMTIRVGGAGANAALASVEAGLHVRLIGCIGEDQLGEWMRSEVTQAGLADELIVLRPGTSGLTVALEAPERDRAFLTYLGVNSDWEAAMIPDDSLAGDNVLLCDYFVTPRLRGQPARELLETARARGARTFFDTSWDPGGFSQATRQEVRDLLPAVDVFLPNDVEARALADRAQDSVQAGRALQGISGGWVVVKLGARGCLAVGPGGTELTVPAPAMSIADSTGAGDAFNAGLIHALADGVEWPEALAAATRFATTIIARPSASRYSWMV